MLTTLEPRPSVSTHRAPAPASTPPPATGSWRYPTAKPARWGYVFAILFSAALHGMMVIGYDARPEKPAPARAAEEWIQMEMPPIPPEEPEHEVHELADASEAPTVAVPQLVDVPSLVPLNDFQQLVDLRPNTAIDPNALKQMTIPVNIGRGSGGATLGTIFNLNDLDRIPEPIARPIPNYPLDAKRQGIADARVVLGFIVDAEGRVLDVRVEETTHELFNQAAVQGLMKWKFRPGMKGGRKVATRMRMPILFSLTED